jgi:uncharacterized membrane protein YphA (DoxX/SURF4 family)
MTIHNLISSKTDSALLIIRSTVGLSFLIHGMLKVLHFQNATDFFGGLGLSSWWLLLVLSIEIVGGILFLAGLFVEWVGIAFAIIMIVATMLASIIHGISGGLEINLILLFSAIAISLSGPGVYTIGYFFGRKIVLE